MSGRGGEGAGRWEEVDKDAKEPDRDGRDEGEEVEVSGRKVGT